MVNVNTKQQSAKAWSSSLTKLNEAQAGQVQITYEDEQGRKCTGYVSLFDLEIEVNGRNLTFGALLSEMLSMNAQAIKTAQTAVKAVASTGSDLLIVKTDELGFVKQVIPYNAMQDKVIQAQALPIDYDKGYYYISNGKIALSEEQKLTLYPDFV